MTPQDIKTIQRHHLPKKAAPVIRLSSDDSEHSRRMAQFCDELKQLAPQVEIKKDDGAGFQAPAMVVGRNENIAYCGVPTGKLLQLFLKALSNTPAHAHQPDGDLEAQLNRIGLPVDLKLYVADQCPHCPKTIGRVQILAADCALMRLRIISAALFPEETKADQVRSVPTLILDDQFRWTGPVRVRELLKLCLNRDPAQLSSASLRQIIEQGDARRVAELMAQSGQIFSALIELLTHRLWPVRLGAMVTAEYLADQSPELAIQLSDRLWDGFAGLSDQAQGDVLHVIGLVKTRHTWEYLQSVISGDHAEAVKEAAAEILSEFKQQDRSI